MNASALTAAICGRGGAHESLQSADVREIVDHALQPIAARSRVLAIVPDRTRDDNTDTLFPLISQELARKGTASLDVLIAQGTHPAMSDAEKRIKIGSGGADIPLLGNIADHHWDRDSELATIGTFTSARVRELTGDLLADPVDIRLNSRLASGDYDTVVIVGATMPHEVAGFAGGAKYLFPGVAGPELTHLTHWLGALATIEQVIGRVETPTRRMIEAAAALVPAPVIAFTSVVTRDNGAVRTRALFAGDPVETVRRAAAVSRQVHVRYTGRRYRRVIALLDPHYDELWVGGKASYKLGAIIEPDGELVIYAPHLDRLSTTHGALIEKYGYAPLESVRDLVAGSDELRANLCVAAHLAHVSYAGRVDPAGRVAPRFRIVLASRVPEEICRRVNLGFADYRSLDVDAFRNDPDGLVVENAGRDLYLVE